MEYVIALVSGCSRQVLDDRLRVLAAGGPFQVEDLAASGAGCWSFRLRPVRPDMVVGFAKVAELLVLVAREFDVQAVRQSGSRIVAAAS